MLVPAFVAVAQVSSKVLIEKAIYANRPETTTTRKKLDPREVPEDIKKEAEEKRTLPSHEEIRNLECKDSPSNYTNTICSPNYSNYKSTITGSGNFCEVKTIIQNRTGMHCRVIMVFINVASKFKSKIKLKANGRTADAKSIMMLVSMGLTYGTEITITAEGPDAYEAGKSLLKLIENKFSDD